LIPSIARTSLAPLVVLLLLGSAFSGRTAGGVRAAAATQITSRGSSALVSSPGGVDGLQAPEFGPLLVDSHGAPITNRSLAHGHGAKTRANLTAPIVGSNGVSGAVPGLTASFDGINHRQQRLASGGNQFTLEPPDQGLCAGNGYVLESVNDALRVYDTAGNPLSAPIALNAFYNYPPAIIRATGARGPELTDPSCYYDTDTQRWFHVVLTLAADFASTGNNSLDIAVSTSANPLDAWKLYSIPVQNDGDVSIAGSGPCPCLGDYPHIGADRYGFYITTNAYPLGPGNFDGAQLYAISKHALAAGVDQPAIVHFGHLQVEKAGTPGFTVWPATAPAGGYADSNGGTEYFLSSMATPEALNTTGFDNRLGLWALTNTSSLDSATPNPILSSRSVDAETYGIPPLSDQKPGDFPLGQCLNVDPCATRILGAPDPFKPEVEGQLDSNDTRMQQVVYVNGLVWGSLDTIVSVNGATRAGVAYFAVQPSVIGNGQHVGPQSAVVKQGYVAVANNNVAYPALSLLPNGRGVIAMTLVGPDYYPSAAYVPISSAAGAGAVSIDGAGVGPQDGFSEYVVFNGAGTNPPTARPRWGDYGAAVADGDHIWMASEFIGQTCTLAQYMTSPFGSCGGTRTALANWGTHIGSVTP